MREEGGQETDRKGEGGRGKVRELTFYWSWGVLISPQKPFIPTHGLKGEKGRGEGSKRGRVESIHLPPFLALPTTTKMTATFNKSPAQPITFQKALLLSPLHARKGDVPSLHKCFPTCKIKRKLHTLSVSSAEAENLVPRHFTLNVETTQLIKRVHRVLSACLFVLNAKAPKELLCF